MYMLLNMLYDMPYQKNNIQIPANMSAMKM